MKLAPLNVPLNRRMQTLGVLYLFFTMLFGPLVTFGITIYLMRTDYWPLVVLYAAWLYYDLDSPKQGSYRSEWALRLPIHKWYADYFPVHLHFTEELKDDKNYLIGYHPHGIYCLGAVINFSSNGTEILNLLPKVRFHLCTLVGQFLTPIRREWAMLHGIIECSRESLHYLLNSEKKGNACVLVVGGAEEILDAHPGMTDLTLMKRKGFIKVALETGASLVPCYSFGENELFEQVENPQGSRLRRFQIWAKGYLGIPPVIFHGRGIFNYSFGMLPYRHEINTVLGRPIHVEKMEYPDQESINKLHMEYIQGLKDVFNENKEKFGLPKDTQVNIK